MNINHPRNLRKSKPFALRILAAGVLGLALASPSHAALVFADTTSTNTVSDFLPVGNLSTSSGLNLGNGTPGVLDTADRFTGTAGSGDSWVTDGFGDNNPAFQDYFFGDSAGPSPVLTFGFTGAITLDSLVIWSYPAVGGGARGGAKLIDVARGLVLAGTVLRRRR